MILSLAAAAIVSTVTVDPVCVWNDRGLHRVTVPVSTLVDNYVDIPKDTRDKLKRRIDKHQYDEMVVIDRDGIRSDLFTYTGMTYMHFGTGKRVCGEVKTDHWAPGDLERAMVYDADGYVLIVPTVCSNLARVTRLGPVRRDRGTELVEEIQPFALIDPIPVKLVEIPDVFYPPLENKDIVPDYRVDPVFRRWPEPSFFDLWGRPLLPGETRTFERVPLVGEPGPVRGVYPVPLPPAPVTPPLFVVVKPDAKGGDVPDDVGTVQPVPEPGTWALMLGGLMLVTWWTRRRT